MSKVRITPTPVLSSLSGNIMHRFILGPTLGEGAFGYVRVGVRTETNEQVCSCCILIFLHFILCKITPSDFS